MTRAANRLPRDDGNLIALMSQMRAYRSQVLERTQLACSSRMGVSRDTVNYLENKTAPENMKVALLQSYARALGGRIEIRFIPEETA